MNLFGRILAAVLAAALAMSPVAALANSTTTNLGLNKPGVGADSDAWGTLLNTNADTLDALFGTGPCLLVAKGGTGSCTASGARTSLGVPYASGSWTPVLSFATAGTSSFTYATQQGSYVCSAPGQVTLSFILVFTPTIGTGSGNLLIAGVPYSFTLAGPGVVQSMSGGWTGWTGIINVAFQDSTHLRFNWLNAPGSAGTNTILNSNLTSGSSHTVVGAITYAASSC